MRRRHSQREEMIMLRRWKKDTAHHRENQWWYDLRGICRKQCACERGYGYYRKIRRENVERGSAMVQFWKRQDRRDERHMAQEMIREQMVEGFRVRAEGRRRVPFHLDYLD